MKASGHPPGVTYFDAHLHRQDDDLDRCLGPHPVFPDVVAQVTNGTHPSDWRAVQEVEGDAQLRVLKAYGVHPWQVDDLPEDWDRQLENLLRRGAVSVGEIGLDQWIKVRDERLQIAVFERQLEIASRLNLPPTLHCLRAWGLLLDCLRAGPVLKKGFLVHGFGGSREVMYQLLDLGGYVSFSAYLADPKRHRMRESARACPGDRILAETDAPDMVPPADVCQFPLQGSKGQRLHHPSDIRTAYAVLAELRGEPLQDFARSVESNFVRLFGPLD